MPNEFEVAKVVIRPRRRNLGITNEEATIGGNL